MKFDAVVMRVLPHGDGVVIKYHDYLNIDNTGRYNKTVDTTEERLVHKQAHVKCRHQSNSRFDMCDRFTTNTR